MEGLLTPEESKRYIEWAEGMGFEHQGSRGAAFGEAYRENGRIQLDDALLADHLWRVAGLKESLSQLLIDGEAPLGLNSNIRVYRYLSGQRFGRHIDESVNVSQPAGSTWYTLLIYLSEVSGGETIFYNHRGRKIASISPKAGLALIHRHGEECFEHEGAAVKSGTKYVLRSDIVYGVRS